ncbi:recombinase family protein [Paenibacillus oceani]|uniref:Recombinase family protein n=1 Tax=Paenibacillus oceani TaxID=2772510 RepID=A0A927CAR2_9BACL|nr:recombinase family protein [Paenibacillus oceani]MBD2863137.1 recombinase family protein [Paenibacillus oceani]
MARKRVACLYRISTTKQLDSDDIPMQRRACETYLANKPDWIMVREYMEPGVSGYKKSFHEREDIQLALSDAGVVYDILLVFSLERLGRREDELPTIYKILKARNAELWSICDGGQVKNEELGDRIAFSVKAVIAQSQSEKTSQFVSEKHKQMAEDGLFRGGTAPYGYKLVKSGVFNKKKKELEIPVINEDTAPHVYQMYMFVYEQGWGSNRIAKHFNSPEVNIPSSTGGTWTTGAINFILRNPIYKGYPAFGKRKSIIEMDDSDDRYVMKHRHAMASSDQWILSKKQNQELVIIPENIWDRVQQIRTKRSPENINNPDIEKIKVTKSPLLFVGMIKCGHCDSPLTTTYNAKKYQLADGTIQKWRSAKYRCSGKALAKKQCNGQTLYSQNRIEGVILDEIYARLDQLSKVDMTAEINKLRQKNVDSDSNRLIKMQKDLEQKYSELATLKGEVVKALMGQSAFKPDMLNGLIEDNEKEIVSMNKDIESLQKKIKESSIEVDGLEELQKHIPVWREVFEKADHDKKKMMLQTIIESITVYVDKIQVKPRMIIDSFISSSLGQYNKLTRSPR